MPETNFEESDSGVGVVARCEIRVELPREPLQLGIAPVSIVGLSIAAGIGAVGLVVIAPVLDILRHRRGAPFAVHLRIVGILIAEADDGLVPARRDIVQNIFHVRPVIINLPVGLSFDHSAGQAVVELHRDGVLVLCHPLVVRPHHQPRHRLHMRNLLCQFHRSPIFI